jgi:hypothetical protein
LWLLAFIFFSLLDLSLLDESDGSFGLDFGYDMPLLPVQQESPTAAWRRIEGLGSRTWLEIDFSGQILNRDVIE